MALVVGIDLGRKSAHDAVVMRRETGLEIGRGFRFTSSPEGFDKLFRRIGAVLNADEPVDFVIDSPGRAWIPVAAVLKARGFRVYRPSAYRVKKVRQAGNRKNKTNRIDAIALARCLMSYPKDTALVFLPQGDHARLDQIVRQRDRVVDSLARRKQRIQDLCEAVNPGLTKHKGFAGFHPSVRKTGDHASSSMPMSKMSCNRYKRCLYLAAENACKWDLEMAAFYHKRRRAGHTHTQAVCAVVNAKLLPRIHQIMKRLKQAEQDKTTRPHYVFRDLSGNPISKAEAKAMITATWGGIDYSKKELATA